MFLVNRSTIKTYNGASPGYTRSAPLFKTVRKEKMDYQAKYELLRKNVWDIMEQLRDLKRKKDGSWPDINTYAVWFSLFQAVTMQPKKKAVSLKASDAVMKIDEQKRS